MPKGYGPRNCYRCWKPSTASFGKTFRRTKPSQISRACSKTTRDCSRHCCWRHWCPETPSLKALTAPRLAALNHGSVVSPVPGREGGLVLQKLRSWAARVGEIRISEDQTPIVSLQITGVDVAPILANAAQADNDGTRRSRLQKILFDSLEIKSDGPLLVGQAFVEYEHVWRGTKRRVDLYFEVVRELSHDRLRGRPGAPVLVLGMPFDPKGRGLADHLAHARNFDRDDGAGGVVWQPSYLSDRTMRDLGTLVRIDYLLAGAGDRLTEAARMFSASDREQAKAVLKSQQSALLQRVKLCLDAAYGIRPDQDGCLGAVIPTEDRLVSLDTFTPRMPAAATMKDAIIRPSRQPVRRPFPRTSLVRGGGQTGRDAQGAQRNRQGGA